MQIEILKRFEKIQRIRGWDTEGMSMTEITDLEALYNGGNPFPKVYREYLYIGGKMNGIGLDEAHGYEWLYNKSREMLTEHDQEINRPFFVIDQLDACEQFGFFYLDENVDDPIVYNCMPPYVEDGFPLIEPYGQYQFSKVLDALIDDAEIADAHFGEYDEE